MLHTPNTKSVVRILTSAGEPAVRQPGPTLVSGTPAHSNRPSHTGSGLLDLAVIVSRRCSSFFAEAAVLVLVFGILDFFMLKGRIDLAWILGALAISVGLLAASIVTDFSAQRWIKAHP